MLKSELKDLFTDFGTRAEHILNFMMPRKVAELDTLYRETGPECKEKFKGAEMNQEVTQFMGKLKVEIFELLDLLNTLRMWVQLNIPKISDGNNFGVSVQEEIVSMLKSGRLSGLGVLDRTVKYFATRGKLLTKVKKYPNVEDYRRSVEELDDKEWIILRTCCLDLRNNYATLYDMIKKNITKIKKPRGDGNHQSMY